MPPKQDGQAKAAKKADQQKKAKARGSRRCYAQPRGQGCSVARARRRR
jgi:hypothetical protein